MPCRRMFLTLAMAAAVMRPAKAQARPVTVFAAASLKEALDEVARAYAALGQPSPTLVYAGSNQLARQIDQGAPADLFLSADEDWMNWLASRQLMASASRINLLSNRLVLIAPRDSTLHTWDPTQNLLALLKGGRLALPDPTSVPAGKYAKVALMQLGLFDQVKDRLAGTENVRVALALVARGEAPLGIVYATDARTESQVKIIGTFAEETHPRIVYPAALTAKAQTGASAFLNFLSAPQARDIFKARGFLPLPALP